MFSLLGKKNKTGFHNVLSEAGISFFVPVWKAEQEILVYGGMVFHATVVTVNEAGLSCFLLRSGRLEGS